LDKTAVAANLPACHQPPRARPSPAARGRARVVVAADPWQHNLDCSTSESAAVC